MQTEDTVASGSISSDKCDAPVQRRFVDRDRKGGGSFFLTESIG